MSTYATSHGQFGDKDTAEAFDWLIKPNSIQLRILESAMRNYDDPVYSPYNIGMRLKNALDAPMSDYTGNSGKVHLIILAIAVIDYAMQKEWHIVTERGFDVS